MNLREGIQMRRAVRDFTANQVEESTIRSLLSAAVQAPSAMNVQPWAFAVVQNTGQLKRYSDRAKQMLLRASEGNAKVQGYRDLLESEGFNIFYNASTLVAIGALEVGIYTEADCWLAAENLMLAATDAGLGTCCIGFAIPLLNTPEVKAEIGFGAAGEVFAPKAHRPVVTTGLNASISLARKDGAAPDTFDSRPCGADRTTKEEPRNRVTSIPRKVGCAGGDTPRGPRKKNFLVARGRNAG